MTHPAYHNGLTIELRDGKYCVTNDFGGRVINTCIDLGDALAMRDRASIGVQDDVIEFVRMVDAHKNRAHSAKLAIKATTGEDAYRFHGDKTGVITYAVTVEGFDYFFDADTHEAALEGLLAQVRAVAA